MKWLKLLNRHGRVSVRALEMAKPLIALKWHNGKADNADESEENGENVRPDKALSRTGREMVKVTSAIKRLNW